MIQPHSDDTDVAVAAHEAATIIRRILRHLPSPHSFDYGGHRLQLSEYGMCIRCTGPIAEAQAAHDALLTAAKGIVDDTIKEHVELAAELFRLEAAAAEVRAELHNGQGSEDIVNILLGHIYDHAIHDSYDHSHHGRGAS